eukprot:3456934-Pleurochrysis_carterae.AAC.5
MHAHSARSKRRSTSRVSRSPCLQRTSAYSAPPLGAHTRSTPSLPTCTRDAALGQHDAMRRMPWDGRADESHLLGRRRTLRA